MENIQVIIIDDEKAAREGVHQLLETESDINIVGVAKNGLEAIELINKNRPDLIFLDIQMPSINGFEVLNSIENSIKPHVIFTTAYDEFALKAFEVHALDFLLKPFSNERFFDAIEKAKKQINRDKLHHINSKIEDLIMEYKSYINQDVGAEWMANSLANDNRFLIKYSGKVIFIELKDLIWIEADGYYINLHTKDKTYLVRKSMKQAEKLLPSHTFMRVHNSNIINKKYIVEIEPHYNGEYHILLSNGSKVKVSRGYKDIVKDYIEEKTL